MALCVSPYLALPEFLVVWSLVFLSFKIIGCSPRDVLCTHDIASWPKDTRSDWLPLSINIGQDTGCPLQQQSPEYAVFSPLYPAAFATNSPASRQPTDIMSFDIYC